VKKITSKNGNNNSSNNNRNMSSSNNNNNNNNGRINTMYADVIIANDLNSYTYIKHLKKSKFCLMMRGDTKSARRIFTSINAGCIPVILSDRLVLPFDKFINYSSFTLQFQEAVALNSPDAFIQHLRSIPPSVIKMYQSNLCQVRQLLTYDSQHIMNPVSLSFVDNFMKIYKSCLNYVTMNDQNLLCDKIKLRVSQKSVSASVNELLKLY
jgi:hypothetical protein